jgi:predicted aconitase with swiveling domain
MISFGCHRIAGGFGKGEALISKDPICFYQTNPETGMVTEPSHALEGQSIANKVLIFPGGKGSTVVQGEGLFQLLKKGNAPKAMIIKSPDTVLVTCAVVWKIPLVDRVDEEFYGKVVDNRMVEVDADKGLITLTTLSPICFP